ncbi:MAG TPA: hypothetical protein VGN82_14875 [Bosea sp. (in: a-proteobacteria)]|jgi:lipopolysaccharide export LptBFGC system permease protein LptF|uniref:hypothetical protein n=1 Tax=Bosea sp. (in: a-proteobacteria) TaxID=1871050 RepID=UPI002E0E6181|nr:hypothetical protein [Bosea sp. (in: a-proteobacteria)]
MLRLALDFFAAKARATLWLLALAYATLAAMLLHGDPRSGWNWAFVVGGALVMLLFVGLVRFWLAFFRGLGDRNG